jgi:peptidoglycan/LPS O-acetylase OafA/YrhL
LLPAYYVSLVASTVLTVLFAGHLGLPALGPGEVAWQVATHLAFLHTLFPGTFYNLNGAYWSLGLEWQLYLGLPLLIWGICRFGLPRTVAAVVLCNVIYRLALGLALSTGAVDGASIVGGAVLPNQLPGRWAEFALGMVAAEVYASRRLERWARFVPGMLIAILALVPLSILASRFQVGHIVYGALFFTVLCVTVSSDNRVARLIAWRPLVALGTISYSLYLVHQPVIQLFAMSLEQMRPDLSPTMVFLVLLLAFPIVLLLAWILFVTVERRTISSHTGGLRVPSFAVGLRSMLPATSATNLAREPAVDVERATTS